MLKSQQYKLLLALIVFLIILYVFIYKRASFNYFDGFTGNLLATLIGVIFGVPIAFEIEEIKNKQEQKKNIQDLRERAKRVCLLLKEELIDNLSRLNERKNFPDTLPLDYFLRGDVWRAMSESTEIRYIDNPELLQSIASAYSYIHIVSKLEDKFLECLYGINVQYSDGSRANQKLFKHARSFDGVTIAQITRAIGMIEEVFEAHHS